MMNLKKESLNVPAVTHHNEGLHRKPRMWQSKTQVQRSTQQKQAVQKNLMEKTEETVQTPLERCTPGTPKAHPKIPKEENSLKNKQVNESEAKQHTPNQPKQRTSMKQHRIPGLVLYISWKIKRAKVCIDFQRFPSSKSSPTNYFTKRVQNGGTRVPTTKAPVFL